MGLARIGRLYSQQLAPPVLDPISARFTFPTLRRHHWPGGEGPPSCPATARCQCPRSCGQSCALPQAGGRCLQLEDNHYLGAKMCN